jgi:PIN domain nuclease of toxin-antitoxin system
MILLDTHVALWLAYQPEKLSQAAFDAISDEDTLHSGISLSAASVYELTWLLERGRLTVSVDSSEFLQELDRRFLILPIDGKISMRAARIPSPFHGDPMDRLIVATALHANLTLITADRSILSSKICKLLW